MVSSPSVLENKLYSYLARLCSMLEIPPPHLLRAQIVATSMLHLFLRLSLNK